MTNLTTGVTAERERIHAQVRDSRRRQGLPEHVQDAAVLDRLAARLLADVRPDHNGAPGTRGPGRRDHPAAAKQAKGRSHATP
jgi:hypothetical protein